VASPILAGITNAQGGIKASTQAELTKVYNEYGNATKYKNLFLDITHGNNGFPCKVGWDYFRASAFPRSRQEN
jgi:hypothetical protein